MILTAPDWAALFAKDSIISFKTPNLEVNLINGSSWRLSEQSPENFTLIVFYRGLHCPICKTYLEELQKNISKFINVDICLWDERLSTVGAFNITSQLDVNVSKREKNIDQNAATFILQGAIDFLNNSLLIF